MTQFRKTGDKQKYNFRDSGCIGRHCWAQGPYFHRAATSGGSRATGDCSHCCLSRAYRGCPTDADKDGLRAERKAAGWKEVR